MTDPAWSEEAMRDCTAGQGMTALKWPLSCTPIGQERECAQESDELHHLLLGSNA